MRRRNSMQWMLRAACTKEDPELFFPPGKGARFAEQVAFARSICGGCAVREQCLTLALQSGVQFGIWAGYSAVELARFRRRYSAAVG